MLSLVVFLASKEEREISKMAKSLPKLENTVIQNTELEKHAGDWAASSFKAYFRFSKARERRVVDRLRVVRFPRARPLDLRKIRVDYS